MNLDRWNDDGSVGKFNTFTTETAGTILGSEAKEDGSNDGKIYPETNGVGSVIGWDRLNNKINEIKTTADTNTTNITNLSNKTTTDINNLSDELTADINELSTKLTNDVNTINTSLNTKVNKIPTDDETIGTASNRFKDIFTEKLNGQPIGSITGVASENVTPQYNYVKADPQPTAETFPQGEYYYEMDGIYILATSFTESTIYYVKGEKSGEIVSNIGYIPSNTVVDDTAVEGGGINLKSTLKDLNGTALYTSECNISSKQNSNLLKFNDTENTYTNGYGVYPDGLMLTAHRQNNTNTKDEFTCMHLITEEQGFYDHLSKSNSDDKALYSLLNIVPGQVFQAIVGNEINNKTVSITGTANENTNTNEGCDILLESSPLESGTEEDNSTYLGISSDTNTIKFKGNIEPSTDKTYSIGSSSKSLKNIYTEKINGYTPLYNSYITASATEGTSTTKLTYTPNTTEPNNSAFDIVSNYNGPDENDRLVQMSGTIKVADHVGFQNQLTSKGTDGKYNIYNGSLYSGLGIQLE